MRERWPEMPDFAAASDDDLRDAARELQRQAHALSFQRRLIHGRISVLESELEVRAAVRRLDEEEAPRR